MKRRIKLTEGDLHRIIKESVKRVIKEYFLDNHNEYLNDLDKYDEFEKHEMDYQDYMADRAMERQGFAHDTRVPARGYVKGLPPEALDKLR